MFRATGKRADEWFRNESGGHRWQRVPPNDRQRRVHTSTVTVAVLREPTEAEVDWDPDDLDIRFTRGSGKGGQHRNKTETCVVVTHVPTGLSVRVDQGRSQHQNKATAMALLRARWLARETEAVGRARDADRRRQVGSGQRGDKRRTIAVQRDQVIDHVLGVEATLRSYRRGEFPGVWPTK